MGAGGGLGPAASWPRPGPRVRRRAAAWGLDRLRPLADTQTASLWRTHDRVLKVFTPRGQADEAAGNHWLAWAGGQGAVALLKAAEDAQLLAYCDGGDLTGACDTASVPAIISVVRRWPDAPPPPGLTPLRDRFQVLWQADDSAPLVATARRVADALLATAPAPVALHGDLHHGNVLGTAGGWVAIDPKGLIGERTYDLANCLLNPVSQPDRVLAPGRARALVEQFSSSLGLPPARLAGYGLVHAVLAALWAREDGEDPADAASVAAAIAAQMQEWIDAIVP